MKRNIKSEYKIVIKKNFDGKVLPETFYYEGTMEEWKNLEKDKMFEDIPCVMCSDGIYIQHI